MSERLLVGLAGYSGSGKSTLRERAVEKWGFWPYYPGEYIRQHARTRYNISGTVFANRDESAKYQLQLREELGPDFLIQPILDADSNRVILDGLRTEYDTTKFAKLGGIIVAINCSESKCYENVMAGRAKRGNRDPIDFATFVVEQRSEAHSDNQYMPNLTAVMSMAHYIIENTGDTQDLYNAFDDIIHQEIAQTP